ncbi:PREDICTED: vasoactive intestinal polypeptide receptor 1 [Thamnophis sirtalis]|uniref:Vasoactive intestinal polypeptide receptor 1 n=1 Tax=Thamnophis sirtalis TaxID=35019 RepID=A0A6I9Y8L2_9SAUR|nr:PREDICTED: vasoactive intestinal polypeptide receptor 1 [Thamnophis sirtalis]
MDSRLLRLCLWAAFSGFFLPGVSGISPECALMIAIQTERDKCVRYSSSDNLTLGCGSLWDNISCWPSVNFGETKVLSCPVVFTYFTKFQGNVSRNCTRDGWSDIYPAPYPVACGYDPNMTVTEEQSVVFYGTVKTGYTIGHSLSLIALSLAMMVLSFFRKLHCTRNYIHMHLFMSFILRAVAVFIKDFILFENGESEYCSTSSVGCKAAMVFFQYCIMANFFWLLVEGLYLHTLLVISFFSEKKYFWWYIVIGWGIVTFFPYYTDAVPIHCLRLAKSTLLLIPLFGIHYTIFAFFPDTVKKEVMYVKLVFELIVGSFQGVVVTILTIKVNGQVQSEMKRKWRRWHLERFLGSDMKYHHPSVGSTGTNFTTQISMEATCSPKSQRSSTFQAEKSLV